MIKYTEQSIPVTADGYYLVQVGPHATSDDLVVADATVSSGGEVSWSQAGADWDVWTHEANTVYELTVICGLDLKGIAEGSRRVLSPTEQALDWYRMEVEALAKAIHSQNHAVVAACLTVLAIDGGNRARNAL
jgi:hypothetical protein